MDKNIHKNCVKILNPIHNFVKDNDVYTCIDGKTLGFENYGINLEKGANDEYFAKVLSITGAKIEASAKGEEALYFSKNFCAQ